VVGTGNDIALDDPGASEAPERDEPWWASSDREDRDRVLRRFMRQTNASYHTPRILVKPGRLSHWYRYKTRVVGTIMFGAMILVSVGSLIGAAAWYLLNAAGILGETDHEMVMTVVSGATWAVGQPLLIWREVVKLIETERSILSTSPIILTSQLRAIMQYEDRDFSWLPRALNSEGWPWDEHPVFYDSSAHVAVKTPETIEFAPPRHVAEHLATVRHGEDSARQETTDPGVENTGVP
jgi:hypothetical protein